MKRLHIDETQNAYQTSKEVTFKNISELHTSGEKVFRFRGNVFEELIPGDKEEPSFEWRIVREVE